MSTLLAVSPHLDDAIFSAGAELARRASQGWRVVVATCFTGNIAAPSGFALACQLDKGLGPEIDYMALRRAEDVEACARIGAEHVHLPFLEAPHRGYESAASLFAAPHPEPRLKGELGVALHALVAALDPALILAPAAIGDHVDHLMVRRVMEQLSKPPVLFWADLPYAARANVPLPGFRPAPCGGRMPDKLAAAAQYRSQTGFQFGGAPAESLLTLAGAEWFTEPRPRSTDRHPG